MLVLAVERNKSLETLPNNDDPSIQQKREYI